MSGWRSAAAVRRGRHRGRRRHRHHPLARERPAGAQHVAQARAVDQLHGDEVVLPDAPEIEDLDHVGVVERDGDLGFVDEHVNEVRAVGQVGDDFLYFDD